MLDGLEMAPSRQPTNRHTAAAETVPAGPNGGDAGSGMPNSVAARLAVDQVPAQARLALPSPAAPAPPAVADPRPPAGSFGPLTPGELARRQTLGVSTDSGPMTQELADIISPTGGGGGSPCRPTPANFEPMVAAKLSTELQRDVPVLAPADAPDPLPLAAIVANEAMPIINTHYAPHAPNRPASAITSMVSRTRTDFGDQIRNNDGHLAEFLEWYAAAQPAVKALTGDKCLPRAWWVNFAGWLKSGRTTWFGFQLPTWLGGGIDWEGPPHHIRERAAVFDTYNTSITRATAGIVQLGRGFEPASIPHTIVHESMHVFQHPELSVQTDFLGIRDVNDIFIEGFAEYLARAVRDDVITEVQTNVPQPLTSTEEATARTEGAYQGYVDKAVELRDTLYRHGQDGEEAIRRAFFLGEGWRFALLENIGTAAAPASGDGSPIETDRLVPAPADVRFDHNDVVLLNPGALADIAAYVSTRAIATIEIVGRTDPVGSRADNDTLGLQRAGEVRTHLTGLGIAVARITVSSRGERDQIPGGRSANRRATVTVADPRNEAPGDPALGR